MHTFKLTYENRDGSTRTKRIRANTWVDAIAKAYSVKHRQSDETLILIEFVKPRKDKDKYVKVPERRHDYFETFLDEEVSITV